MAKTNVEDHLRPDWMLLRLMPDNTIAVNGNAVLLNATEGERGVPWSGADGVPGATNTALRTALANFWKAKAAYLLETNPATHDVVFQNGNFVEVAK